MKRVKNYEYDSDGNIELTKEDEMVARLGKSRAFIFVMLGGIKLALKFITLPVVRKLHPWVNPKKNFATALPINEELKDDNTILPVQIISELIEKSSYRMVMHTCGCRLAYECKNHPTDIGCLCMGEDILQISPGLGRMVSKEEAHAHVQKAIDAGLVIGTGKAQVDTFLFRINETGKFLTVCFCCHCCCINGLFSSLPTKHFNEIFPPLEGIEVRVTDECTGCEKCVEYCLYDAISIENGKAELSDKCRRCGRCATNCPSNAVKVSIDNPNFHKEFLSRLESYTDVT